MLRPAGLAVGLAVVLGACTLSSGPGDDPPSSPTQSEPTSPVPTAGTDEGGTLRFALGRNPASIDPRFVADAEGQVVVDAVFDSLVALDEDLRSVVPAAAEDWEVSDDQRTWTFHLRPDATYHDGTPVRAGDFVRSFRRIVDRGQDQDSLLFHLLSSVQGHAQALNGDGPLRGVRAVDAETLRIRLSRPDAEFLLTLAHPALAPVPPEADDDPDAWQQRPIGNGPFALTEPWRENQFIRVARFEDHWEPPRLREVVFPIFADDASRQQQYEDFQNGRIDVAAVPPEELDEAVEEYGRARGGSLGPGVVDAATSTVYFYGFNTELPPYDDPELRRALSMLADREGIVEDVLLGTRVPARGLVPPGLPAARTRPCDLCRHDPEAAIRTLAGEDPTPTASPTEAPTPSVEGPLEIVHVPGDTNEGIANRYARDIGRALDVEVTTRAVPLRQLVQQVREGEVGFFQLGWQMDHPGAGSLLTPLFHSDNVGTDNLTRFSSEQVDELLDRARRTEDPRERAELYGQAETRVLAAAPVVPMFAYRHLRVIADGVEDLRINPLGGVSLEDAWKVTEA